MVRNGKVFIKDTENALIIWQCNRNKNNNISSNTLSEHCYACDLLLKLSDLEKKLSNERLLSNLL